MKLTGLQRLPPRQLSGEQQKSLSSALPMALGCRTGWRKLRLKGGVELVLPAHVSQSTTETQG